MECWVGRKEKQGRRGSKVEEKEERRMKRKKSGRREGWKEKVT